MSHLSIDHYMVALRARAGAALDDDTAEEVRGHLEDAARESQLRGLESGESARAAVRRFGPPEEIGLAFERARRVRRPFLRGPRPLLAALVVASSLAALGGGAVAAAHTPQQAPARHARVHHAYYSHPAAPAAPAARRPATAATERGR
jgi:hypothetical protein